MVDVVDEASEGEFPGLFPYLHNTGEYWLDNTHVVLNTQWRSFLRVVVVDIESGTVRALSGINEGCNEVLDVVPAKRFDGEKPDIAAVLVLHSSPVEIGVREARKHL